MYFAIIPSISSGVKSAVYILAHGQHGGKTARADASGGVKAELFVGSDAAVLHTENGFELFHEVTATLNVASGAETDTDGVCALGVEQELGVECRDSVNLGNRHAQAERYVLLNFGGRYSVRYPVPSA